MLWITTECTAQNKNDITGFWKFNSKDDKGVVKIDASTLSYFFEGIGYVSPSNYFIKNDSLYSYRISNNDTTVLSTYFIRYSDSEHFDLTHGTGIVFLKRISEKEMSSFIKETEQHIVDEEIIPIRVEN